MSSRYEESMKAKHYLPFRMGYLTPEMVLTAEAELGETEETKRTGLLELRALVEGETRLTCPRDDAYLLQFLRARKFNVKKAFNLIQSHYQVKRTYSDLYDHCDLDALRGAYRTRGASCLPYRDENGCAILFFQMAKWNPDEFPVQVALKTMTSTILSCIEDPATQVCGVRLILDVRGASLKQVRCITPRYITLFSKALRNCLPVRFKGIHIYNESTVFQYIWSVLKFFLTEKIKTRAHFHGSNQKQLQKFIPKDILPSEYGGENYEFSKSDWFLNEIENFFDRYMELHNYGYKD